MTPRAPSHANKDTEMIGHQKSTSHIELCPMLQSLEKFAVQKYDSYMAIASSFDDAQEVFTSKAVNFINGNNLLAKVALRSAEIGLEKA